MNWMLLTNSLVLAGLVATGATLLGVLASLAVAGGGVGVRRVGMLSSLACLALPAFVPVNSWMDWFGMAGWLRPWIPFELYSLAGAVLIMSFMYWPLGFLAGLSSWQRVGREWWEQDPGVRGWPWVRWVLVPAVRGAAGVAWGVTFVLALNHFGTPALLQLRVYPAELWVSFSTRYDYAEALRLAWPMVVVPACLLVWMRRTAVPWPVVERAEEGSGWAAKIGWVGRVLAGCALALAVGLGVIFPLAQLVGSWRTWAEWGGVVRTAWGAALWSVGLAAVTATVATGAAMLWCRVRRVGVVWLAYLVPGVLLGIGASGLLTGHVPAWVYPSAGAVGVLYAVRFLGPAWSLVREAVTGLDPALAEDCRLAGGSLWDCWRWVWWRQVWGRVAVAWYAVYLWVLGDVETLVMVVPPGVETLALRIFNLLHYGHNGQVNALCLFLVLMALLPAAVVWGVRAVVAGAAVAGRGPGARLGVAIAAAMVACWGAGCGGGSEPVRQRALAGGMFGRVEVIGERGTGLGQLTKPRSLAVDGAGRIHVVDMTGRVQRFSPEGVFEGFWRMPETELGKPKGMGLDAVGRVVVIEPHYSRVNHFTTTGRLELQWGGHGTNVGQLAFPRAIAVAPDGGLWVSEYGVVERLQKFSADGAKVLAVVGHAGYGPGEFNRVEGLAVDREGRIYAADSCNHRVQVFGGDGRLERVYGRAGTGPGEFSYPYDIRVDEAGYQFVCEFGNSRVQVFDRNGAWVETVGSAGSAPGQFSNPWSLALDEVGNLYVADALNHRVQRFVRRQPLERPRRALVAAGGGGGEG